jgi:hypothetical protein
MAKAERIAHRDELPREVLPIPDRPRAGLTTFAATDPGATLPPIERLRPPTGAPNVLIVLLDDVGFGASSAFGGPVQTPTAERLAGAGLRYTRFHTCAMCAPTRAALLSGRNHHSIGFGSITETATAAPGYNTTRPNTKATLQETLRLNGYSTAMFGKCHEVPELGGEPGRAVLPLADRERLRVLLRLHRRGDESVLSGPAPGHGARGPASVARGGLHAERRSGRPCDRLDPSAPRARAGSAVLCLLRDRRHPCAAPRPA